MLPAPQQPARSQLSGLIGRLVPRPQAARAPFEEYREDPLGFFRDVLGVEPWGRHHGLPAGESSQIDMILAVRDYPAVACRSGHKTGKALDVNTPVPTPSGWTTMGDIRLGDVLFDDRGQPCNVTGVSEVSHGRPCFDVEFSDGTVVTADAEHEWLTWSAVARRAAIRAKNPRSGPQVVTTEEIGRTLMSNNRGRNHAVKIAGPIECAEKALPMDPYVIGAWLGDGTSASPTITTPDLEIVEEIRRVGYTVKRLKGNNSIAGLYSFNELHGVKTRATLRSMGVLNNKHVPAVYLRGSAAQRLALLQGLMDTDGCCWKNGSVRFYNTNRQIAGSAFELAASLGFKPHFSTRRAMLYGKDCGETYSVAFTPHTPVFRLPKKLNRQHSGKTKSTWVTQREVVAVRPRPSVPVRCITVDSPSHLFLCSRAFIPTHNSTSGAGIALWWVLTRVGGHVILTAPTYNQVKKPIWAEIRSFAAQTHPAQRGKTLPDLRKIGRLSLEPNGGFEVGPNWGIWGKSTTKPENIAGPSGAEVLYEIDEASGYDGRLLEAIQGGLAGCGKIVLWGNPTQTSGPFYDAFHERRDAWKCLHVSSTSTPNFYGRRVPGLADPQWLEDTAKKNWGGPGNAVYDVRVLGKFPGQAPNAIVGLDLLEAAKARWLEAERSKPCADLGPADGRLELGVDVSRDGEDETVVAPRRGKRAYPLRVVTFDPKLVTAKDPVPLGHQAALGAVAVARALRRPNEGKDAPRNLRPRIKVDEIGNGAACLDHLLAQFADEFEVVGVKVSQRADAEVKVAPGITAEAYYENKRAQLTFGTRDWLVAGGCVPPDGKLDAELVASTQHMTTRGKTAVEGKDEVKKRLKRSPDRKDALDLSCYEPPPPKPRVVTCAGDASDENGGWGNYSVG